MYIEYSLTRNIFKFYFLFSDTFEYFGLGHQKKFYLIQISCKIYHNRSGKIRKYTLNSKYTGIILLLILSESKTKVNFKERTCILKQNIIFKAFDKNSLLRKCLDLFILKEI